MTTTLSALQAGNPRVVFVLAIDGYPHLISNVPQALVQAAWSATDWATKTVIGGLTIDLNNHQKLNPWNPFEGGGSLIFRVQPDADDTFGIDLHRTDDGAETLLEETVDRTTPLFVGLVDGFPLTGEGHIGTECFSWGFLGGRRFQPTLGDPAGSNRGKYVAFGAKDSATTYGSIRFAEHHRVATQNNGVVFQPVVSEQPRIWKGRRVSLWQHVYESDGSLNTKANALCIFLGELTEPQDESDTGHSSVLCEHLLTRIPKTTLLRDQWQATVDYGVVLSVGHQFSFEDFDGTIHIANPLVVIASSETPTSTNQVRAGQYGHEELAALINGWLGGESAAGRISGNYTLVSPEDVNGTARTVMHAFIAGASGDSGHFKMKWPASGWAKPFGFSGSQIWIDWFYLGADHQLKSPGAVQPFSFATADVNNTFQINLEDQTGTFRPQNNSLPAAAKAMFTAENPPHDYALFLLEGETPMLLLGSLQGNALRRIRPIGSGFGLDLKGWAAMLESKLAVGSAAPKLRQVFVFEAPLRIMLRWLFMSTGTELYNHPTYDALPHGLGIPYDALGENFELSCDLLPGADNIVTVTLEKPRTMADLFSSDLVIRNAHLVFREGQFRWVSWSSPSSALVSLVLDEETKAEPIDNRISQRSASVLDSSWLANVCKISYNRDIAKSIGGGEDVYLAAPIFLEDATSVDDMGGTPTVKSVDLRNVYNDADQIGQGVRALVSGFLSWFTWWSRPLWKIRRSIAPTLYEGFGIGDVVAVTDPFVRDPTSGRRGIVTRPGLVVGHQYKLRTFGAPEQMQMAGECDVVFLHNDRTYAYAPAAEVDETKNDGGYTAGWDGNATLQFKAHEHSTAFESVDVASFSDGDNVRLIEIDPDDPDAADVIDFDIDIVDIPNNRISANESLAFTTPAFDITKRYRLVYQPYPSVEGSQTIKSFQAGQNMTIAEESPPDVYGAQTLSIGAGRPTQYGHTTLPELPATASYGPNLGAARDCAYDKETSLLIDNLIDHVGRLSAPTYDLDTSVASGVDGWQILKVEIICLGQGLYSGTTQRYLHLAPNWRNANAFSINTPTQLRVWVSGYPPSGTSNANPYVGTPGYVIKAPACANTWTVMPPDTLWRQEEPIAYPLGNFNGHQFVYIITEGTTNAQYRGLCECREAERQEIP